MLENGSSTALHHHSLTNEKFRSFAALRQRQEMNLTLDCNHLQLRIRSLLPSCRATTHAHLQLITKHEAHAIDVRQWENTTLASIMTMRSPTKSSNHSSACAVGPETYSGKHVSSVRTLCAVREHVWVSRNRLLQSFIDPRVDGPK